MLEARKKNELQVQVEKDDEYRFLNGKVFQWQRAMNLSKIKKEQANKLP